MKELNGLIAVFTSPRGLVVSAASFDHGYDECIKKSRLRLELAYEVAKAYCAPDFLQGMDAYTCEKIMNQLCNNHGCKVTITPVTAPVEEPCQK